MINPAAINPNDLSAEYIRRLLEIMQDNLSRSSQVHMDFLRNQTQALQTLTANIQLPTLPDLPSLPNLPAIPSLPSLPNLPVLTSLPANLKTALKSLINKKQLQEFGTGSIAKCFGPDFKILDQRKTPRIPNGDLLMMDRVLELSGQQGKLRPPASVTTEFEVKTNAWFLKENPYPNVPLAVLMEIALQPCGILSAWLGTSLSLPAEVNIFRNLDGEMSFLSNPDLAGATIRNHARLLTSVSSGGMLIQKYSFELSVNEQNFATGESSFGYFRQEAMDNQAGLDSSEPTALQTLRHSQYKITLPLLSLQESDTQVQHFKLIDKLVFTENSGIHNNGLIVGETALSGNEWFYSNHFYQDPVMPGSLGAEAITQAMWAYIRHLKPDNNFRQPVLDFSNNQSLEWKYRGQVIPANKKVSFEIHLKNNPSPASNVHLLADADFWVDNLKIYAFKNISMTLREG